MYVSRSVNYVRSNAKVIWYTAVIAAAALVGVAARCYDKLQLGHKDGMAVRLCNMKLGGR